MAHVSQLGASISALEARLSAHHVGSLDTEAARDEVQMLRTQLQERDVRDSLCTEQPSLLNAPVHRRLGCT